eukprot:TRINITY_DN1113_c0_g2_i1.p1 TRINITY_DN1113_c0_g2~~TRINITY_DN1113_c0_g2_i1.p1  ORF type:complete len:241 (-),score=44.98 TRINITY_DN1113_c0_g2_i1:592-1314(-)
MATNILHYVPWFAPTREAVLSSKSTTSGIKFSYTSNTRACLVKKYSPATASFQDALQICPNMKVRNITACAKISEAPSESGPESAENAQQDNADNAQEVSADDGQASSDSNEAALESSPRAPRPKLSEVMGILHRRAIEAVDKKRPIPDVRVGDVLQLKVTVPRTRRRYAFYKGVVISRQNSGIQTTIRLRRIIAGVGIEIVFPLYSPLITEVVILERRKVRRARLYYLREKLPKYSSVK